MRATVLLAALLLPGPALAGSAIGGQFERSLNWHTQSPVQTDGPRITHDTGGEVRSYQRARNGPRVIDGLCASACLLLLTEDSCATPRGILAWHLATSRVTGLPDLEESARLLATYPVRLRDYIRAHGGMTSQLQSVRATAVFPRCQNTR